MLNRKDGFTLVELMVALALTAMVLAAVYRTFAVQQKVYTAQEQVVEAQQELRSGMELMVRELRMAGYNPTGSGLPAAAWGIVTPSDNAVATDATSTSVTFGWDKDGDGVQQANELVTYTLNGTLLERRENGVAYDSSTGANAGNIMADNVDALDFVYLNSSGTVIATPVSSDDASKIRSIQVTMVVRSDKPDKDYTSTASFSNQQGTVIYTPTTGPPDTTKYRRRILSTTVRCRNLGL